MWWALPTGQHRKRWCFHRAATFAWLLINSYICDNGNLMDNLMAPRQRLKHGRFGRFEARNSSENELPAKCAASNTYETAMVKMQRDNSY